MKEISSQSENQNLLQQFAAKSQKKRIIFGDRAVTWNRCSTKKQDSIEWQEKVTGEYVNQRCWNLIRAFGVKESAKTDDRKEFQEMLKFCVKENISHIVFYSYDRFSRSGDISILKKLREQGIKVHAATQGADDETPSGRMTQKLYLMFAEMENEQRREKIIEGIKNKLRKGEWNTAPPIGYEKRYVTGKKEHDHDKKQCFINEIGKLIRQAFHWKDSEKLNNLEVLRRLKTMGLSLKLPQLTRIFRNPFYCGYITSRILDGELVRGKHEPLISEEIFLRVNGVGNCKPHGWNIVREHDEMPLKESVTCGKCGRPFTAYIKKEKYVYYKCPNNGCYVNMPQKKLHDLFAAELSVFTVNEALIPLIKGQLETTYWSIHQRDTSREKPMKDELARLKNEMEAMEMNLAIGNLPPALFQKHSTSHKHKIELIESELKELTNDSSNFDLYLENALFLAHNLLNTWRVLDYRGKVNLQKLVFPDGLVYMPENDTVRTQSVNPIFSAISSISSTLAKEVPMDLSVTDDKFHSVYSMFASSNFFWENLSHINNELSDFKGYSISWRGSIFSFSGQTAAA